MSVAWMDIEAHKKPRSVSILDDKVRFNTSVYDDYHIIETIWPVLDSADVLLGQNIDSFDVKVFNWRAKLHGFGPVARVQTIDSLRESRKVFRPPSHRLNYKGMVHGLGGKQKTGGMQLWRDIALAEFGGNMEVAEKAIKKMLRYNRRDVVLVKDVYLNERSYYKKHPNRILYDVNAGCPTCGGHESVDCGFAYTSAGKYQRYKCSTCGRRYQDTHSTDRALVK